MEVPRALISGIPLRKRGNEADPATTDRPITGEGHGYIGIDSTIDARRRGLLAARATTEVSLRENAHHSVIGDARKYNLPANGRKSAGSHASRVVG